MPSKYNQISRRNFLKLTGATLATGLVVACGGATTAPQVTTAPKATDTKATEVPKAQLTAAPAVELVYFYGTRATFKDVPAVQDEMNKILKDKIGATIQLNPLDWSAFSDKMQLKNLHS